MKTYSPDRGPLRFTSCITSSTLVRFISLSSAAAADPPCDRVELATHVYLLDPPRLPL